ncbi:DUF2784 domain-containing protein [Alkalimonas sp.]|uniref:DUF2784 domain-containing protein n=1 Tax=Alkalimonas sp. TaxID=1872453 RepID=UPI00263ABBA5|nr:DUF2784 domain-containing protein [Alkalimonas sp.]MCC5827099.1 DUF2784 domain-containing protein [Alkalimonas sp.]
MTTPWYERVPAPALLADIVLVVHGLIVLFVLGGLLLTLIGGWRGWCWVRNSTFRLTQLAVVAVVLVQSLRGRYCPLTYWEVDLRRAAGLDGFDVSFIEYWVSNLIYYDAPGWVFNVGYTLFFGFMLLSWYWFPPKLLLHKRYKDK